MKLCKTKEISFYRNGIVSFTVDRKGQIAHLLSSFVAIASPATAKTLLF
jgi:hypothetical protein